MLPADCLTLKIVPTFIIKWWILKNKDFPAYSKVLTTLII